MSQRASSRFPWQWLRGSVRSLMLLVLMLAIWLAWITHCARVQHDAVAAIIKSGGQVVYDGNWDTGGGESDGFLRPKWLVDLIGIDYLSNVTEVSLNGGAYDADPEMIHIGRLTRINKLIIRYSSITDAGLRPLRSLKNLKQVFLRCAPICDEGHGGPTMRCARLAYHRHSNINPLAIPHLMVALQRQCRSTISYQGGMLLSDPNLIYFPLVYMHGEEAFSLSPGDLAALKRHLSPGGATLFADAACGSANSTRHSAR